MVSRLTGALVRAVLVLLLVALPSVVLGDVSANAKQMVALVALLFGALTLIEYSTDYPSLVEFRHAPPLNRIRYLSIFLTVLVLALILRGEHQPSQTSAWLEALGSRIGHAIDFPFSPVRLVLLAVSQDVGPRQIELIRTAAGISYMISLAMLAVLVIFIRLGRWPDPTMRFNVWVNLPTFDPTAGRDVVYRLERDARINLTLGFLLPFLMPLAVKAAASGLASVSFTNPQVMIWTMAAWSFLPACLFMRGLAMGRVAEMIREQRRMTGASAQGQMAAV